MKEPENKTIKIMTIKKKNKKAEHDRDGKKLGNHENKRKLNNEKKRKGEIKIMSSNEKHANTNQGGKTEINVASTIRKTERGKQIRTNQKQKHCYRQKENDKQRKAKQKQKHKLHWVGKANKR